MGLNMFMRDLLGIWLRLMRAVMVERICVRLVCKVQHKK
ncbi:hypothetical protein ACVW0J_001919 [Bradyrhizobium sp. i1.7.7]